MKKEESEIRTKVRELADEFLQQKDPTGWFEELYSKHYGNPEFIPWADLEANPNLINWLNKNSVRGSNLKALIVGCGLGDDAEALSEKGFDVTAFDISPSAIAWCRERFPDSSVNYVIGNILEKDISWIKSFDFILESYTLQALPESVRSKAIAHLSLYLAPKGTLLVICRGRNPEEDPGSLPPWALTKKELSYFESLGLSTITFEDYIDLEDPPIRRFRIQYLKNGDSR